MRDYPCEQDRVEDSIHGVPRVTPKPIGREYEAPFLGFEACRTRPGLAGVLADEDTVLADDDDVFLVVAKKRALPDIDCRSLRLPTRSFILADE